MSTSRPELAPTSIWQWLRWISANSDNPKSVATRLRTARFRQFEMAVNHFPRPLRILDVGGRTRYWEERGWAGRPDIYIFSLNLKPEKQTYENITPITGNATDLSQFEDKSFDVVFSNSVIEHLFVFESQQRMAEEVKRVGKIYWVQTPNFWFPVEPHFLIPGWQWFPIGLRAAIIQRWRCGSLGPYPDPLLARRAVEEIQLLTRKKLEALFPDATVHVERFCGIVKSWTVTGSSVKLSGT
jgi:hypothetical protein